MDYTKASAMKQRLIKTKYNRQVIAIQVAYSELKTSAFSVCPDSFSLIKILATKNFPF